MDGEEEVVDLWEGGAVGSRELTQKALTFLSKPQTILTAAYSVAFVNLGLMIASIGPLLLELAEQTHTTLHYVGYVFAGKSVGYLLGTVLGGPLFDVLDGNKLLSMSLLGAGVSCMVVPWTEYFVVVCVELSVQSVAMGFLDTGANVLIIRMFQHNVAPYLQTVHFSFAVGALLSPFLISIFLKHFSHEDTIKYIFWLMAGSSVGIGVIIFMLGMKFKEVVAIKKDEREEKEVIKEESECEYELSAVGEDSRELISSEPLVESEEDRREEIGGRGEKGRRVREYLEERKKGVIQNCDPTRPQFSIIFSASAILGWYVGAEITYGGFVDSYAVLEELLNEADAALLVSVFWMSIALGRFLAIFISLKFSSSRMLVADLVGVAISCAIFLLFPKNMLVLWPTTVVFGLSMASIFPTTISLAEDSIEVTGKIATIFVIGASFGEMLIPLIVTNLITQVPYFLFVAVSVCCCSCCLLVIFWFFRAKLFKHFLFGEQPIKFSNSSSVGVITYEQPLE